MNILPKKRWHVRTKDNIARVRRDEAQAAEEEKEKQRRAKLAEQEARTALLRQRARGNDAATGASIQFVTAKDDTKAKGANESNEGPPYSDAQQPAESKESIKDKTVDMFSNNMKVTTADIYTEDGNINFFKDLETGKDTTNSLTNKEREQEDRQEKEKYEKQIGLLTYLGQDSLEATKSKEWYHDKEKCVSTLWNKCSSDVANNTGTHLANDTVVNCDASSNVETVNSNAEVGLKSKKFIDPLNDMIKYAKWKPSKSNPVEACSSSLPEATQLPSVAATTQHHTKDKKLRKMLKKKKKLDERIVSYAEKSKRKKHKRNKSIHSKYESKSEIRKRKRTDDSDSSLSENDGKRKRRKTEHRSSSSTYSSEKIYRKSYNDSSQDKVSSRKSSTKSRSSKKSHKSSKKSRRSGKSSSDSSSGNESSDDSSYTTDSEAEREKRQKLEKMRSERLAREAVERKREQRLLSGQHPDQEPLPPPKLTQQRYNSQFNPFIAKQNKL